MQKTLLFIPWLKTTDLFFLEKNNWIFEEKKQIKIENPKEESVKIFTFLDKIKINEIENIIICNWPWRFMSMRICWTITNTLKNQFPKIKLFQIPTYIFLEKISLKSTIILQLNQSEILFYENWKNEKITFEELNKRNNWKNEKIKWFWNVKQKLKLPENFEEIEKWKNYLEIIWDFFNEKYETKKVEIIY